MTITELIKELNRYKEVYGDCEIGIIREGKSIPMTEILEPYTSYWYFIGDLHYSENRKFKSRKRVISLI